jgi:hypothetical protein
MDKSWLVTSIRMALSLGASLILNHFSLSVPSTRIHSNALSPDILFMPVSTRTYRILGSNLWPFA